ncbi:hypothetical protein [Methylomicrobium lacus]|uniref:hypothetical protein n=1 Tax=Methylomicrobium lacus TaxID=136992 RepID=UPI00045EB4ED|nr:hypothetical protein [Methylomicrobium lacus]
MSDQVEKAYDDVRNLAKDYFGIGDSESETLMKLAKRCAQTAGVPMAGVGAVALAGVSSVTIPLVGAVPGYLAGALAGFVGGTTACMIARRSSAEQVKQILGQSGMTEQSFKDEVRKLISVAEKKAGYCSNAS